jgi:hypothetical protein
MIKPDTNTNALTPGPEHDVGVQNQLDLSAGHVTLAGPDFSITYEYERKAGKIHIYPYAPYFSLLEQGGPISGLRFWWSAFAWQFPKLSVKMANNTDATVLVTEATVEVKDSQVDTNPVILIEDNPNKVGYFSIINEGWGNVISPKLKFQIAPEVAYDSFTSEEEQHLMDLPSFLESMNVKIESYVPSNLRGEKRVAVFGDLEYQSEGGVSHWLRFRTRVSLVRPGPGMPAPPSYLYELFLEAGRSGYVKNLPLSQEIKPGETDHFLIRIGTNKSSRFDLAFAFRTAGGAHLPETQVLLDIFLPRTQAPRICQRSTAASP